MSAIDSNGRTIWIADAHRGDGKRFVVHANEKLSAFVEFEVRFAARPRVFCKATGPMQITFEFQSVNT